MSEMEENYKAIVETSLDGVYQVDRSGAFMYMNESFAGLLGYRREELTGRPFAELLSRENLPRIEQMVQDVFSGNNVRDEASVKHRDGHEVPVLFSATPLRAEDDIIGLTGILRDITERKKLEKEVQVKEEYFETIIENSMDGILVLNGEGTIIYETPSFERLWGYKQEERIGRNSLEFVHPDDLPRMKQVLAELLQQPGSVVTTVARKRHRDGSWRDIESIAKNVLDHPAVQGIVLNIRDITDLKRSIEAQRQAEEWCSVLLENTMDAVVIVQDGVIKFANHPFAKIGGYQLDELIGQEYVELVTPEYRDSIDKRFQGRIDGSIKSSVIQLKAMHKDGQIRYIEASGTIINYKGKPAEMAIVRDITELKQAEEALSQSEQRYRMLAENMRDIIWTVDMNLKLTYVSPSVQQMSGYSVEEVMSMGLMGLDKSATPASLDRINPIMSKVMAAIEKGQGDLPEALALELNAIRKDGAIVPVEVNIQLLRDPAGHPIGFLGNTRDITERRKAEEALAQSEEFLRALVETVAKAGYGIAVLQNTPEKEATPVFLNDEACKMVGYSRAEALTKSAWDFFESSELVKVQDRYRKRQRGEQVVNSYETILLRKDGTSLPIEVTATSMVYRGNIATVFFSRDITERKRSEELIAQSEEWHRALVETAGRSGQAIAVLQDRPSGEARIVFANDTACKMSGYKRSEMLSLSAWDFIQPPEIKKARERYRLRQRGKRSANSYETTLLRKDGTSVPIEAGVSTMIYQGNVASVLFAKDITERRLAQEKLKSYQEQLRRLSVHLDTVREQEMKRIARDIHDDLGQTLATLKWDTSWLRENIGKDQQDLLKKIEAMERSIDVIIKRVRTISSQLRPEMLDDLGLAPALEWQLNQFQDRTGIKCQLNVDDDRVAINDRSSTAFFRVFQEALTNIAFHSNATRVKVNLRNQKGRIVLKIVDNGRGITQEQIDDPKSFGLMNMQERANSIGGDFKISGVSGKGTTVVLSILTDQEDVSR